MPNKTQAKAAIDAAVVLAKNDIDNILPVGVNITDGSIQFAPNRLYFTLDAAHVSATADSWASTIAANLTTAGRGNVTLRRGRRADDPQGSEITIQSVLANYRIINAT